MTIQYNGQNEEKAFVDRTICVAIFATASPRTIVSNDNRRYSLRTRGTIFDSRFQYVMQRTTFGYSATLLMDLGASSVLLGLGFQLRYLGHNAITTGLVFAWGTFAYFLTCSVLARFFSQRAAYPTMVWAFAIIAITLPILTILKTVTGIVIAVTGHAAALAMYFTSVQSWITENATREQTKHIIGGYGLAWTSGMAMGPLLGAAIGRIWSTRGFGPEYQGPYLLAVVTTLIVAAMAFLRFSPTSNAADSNAPETFWERFSVDDYRRFLAIGLLMNLLANYSAGIVRHLVAVLHVGNGHGELVAISQEQAGYLCASMSGAIFAAFLIFRHFQRWALSFVYVVGLELIVLPAGMVFLYSHSYPLMVVAATIFGFMNGFAFYSAAAYGLQIGEKGQRNIALNEAAVGFGGFLGSIIGGFVAQYVGTRFAFSSPIVAVLLVLPLQFWIYRGAIRHSTPAIASSCGSK